MANSISVRRSLQLDRERANTRFERLLGNSAQISVVLLGCIAVFAALQIGQVILAPVMIAIIVGLMCGPAATFLERRGVPSALSAGIVVIALVLVIAGAAFAFAAPLSAWVGKVPMIWDKLRDQIANLKQPLEAIGAIEEQVRSIFGSDTALNVTVADGGPVTSIAAFAPALLGQFLIFFGGLYFFLAGRESLRIAILSVCVTRKLRWRTAHVFRDVGVRVSRYLLSIALINLGLGVLVGLAMWATGMPSPVLWGGMAFLLNFIPFLGQGTMLVLIFLIGLGTRAGLADAIIPVACYWVLSFIESQVVTPNLIGRTMTINPFLIFLSLTFWIWAWGPVGGLVAVPSLLVLNSFLGHILPARMPTPKNDARKIAAEATVDAERAAPQALPPEPTHAEIAKAAPVKPVRVAAKPKRAPRKPAIPASP